MDLHLCSVECLGMNFCRNVTFSGGLPSEHEPEQLFSSSCTTLASLDDLFSANSTMQEGDVNSEWLSIFVEDCLSTSASSILPVVFENVQDKSSIVQEPAAAAASKPIHTRSSGVLDSKFEVAGKARGKRSRRPTRKNPRKCIGWSQQGSPDPPLLQQAYWLADSELILPKQEEVDMIAIKGLNVQQQPRRCSHCLSQKTPQWRAGPLGPKTLCNACGVRYKSGRLLPEYRPAKSPTFVSYKHSNSHKKVLEMRTMFNG